LEFNQTVAADERHNRAQCLHAPNVHLEVVALPLNLEVLLHQEEPSLTLLCLELITFLLDEDKDVVEFGEVVFKFLVVSQVGVVLGLELKL